MSAALRALGLRATAVDRRGGVDLLERDVQDRILAQIAAGQFRHVHLAPPCSSFSLPFWAMWRSSGATRSSRHPEGSAHPHPKEVEGNKHVAFTCRVIDACNASGVTYSIEQPLTSLMWLMPSLRGRLAAAGVFHARVDMCACGEEYKKPTVIAGTAPGLASLNLRCTGDHEHVLLQGSGPKGSRTAQAASYGVGFARVLAAAIVGVTGDQGRAGAAVRVRDDPGPRVVATVEGDLGEAAERPPPPQPSGAELEGARAVVRVVDAAPAVWQAAAFREVAEAGNALLVTAGDAGRASSAFRVALKEAHGDHMDPERIRGLGAYLGEDHLRYLLRVAEQGVGMAYRGERVRRKGLAYQSAKDHLDEAFSQLWEEVKKG